MAVVVGKAMGVERIQHSSDIETSVNKGYTRLVLTESKE